MIFPVGGVENAVNLAMELGCNIGLLSSTYTWDSLWEQLISLFRLGIAWRKDSRKG